MHRVTCQSGKDRDKYVKSRFVIFGLVSIPRSFGVSNVLDRPFSIGIVSNHRFPRINAADKPMKRYDNGEAEATTT